LENPPDDPLLKERASIFNALGMEADPWQKQLIESPAKQILVCCSRQSGKSFSAAACALTEALLNPPATILIISRAQRQSAEVLRKVKELYRGLRGEKVRRKAWTPRSIRPEIEEIRARGVDTEEETVRDAALAMELANGSRIIALPGKPDTIVGYSAISLLILDEAARVPDNLYRLVRPMLAVSQGKLLALSTPLGKRGWFWSEWQRCDEALASGKVPSWERIRVLASECPRISAAFLEEERLSIGDRWFRQEYECSFEDTVDAVFSSSDIHRALREDVLPWDEVDPIRPSRDGTPSS
jgi:hypothetical protein